MSDALGLIDHWRQVTAKGQPVSWGCDRATIILDHIDALGEAVAAAAGYAEQLRETIAWNRDAAAAQARELAEWRRQRDAMLVAEIQRLTALVEP